MKIDLILIGKGPSRLPKWDPGKVLMASDSVSELSSTIKENIDITEAEYFLFWNACLGLPDIDKIRKIINLPGDVWHCGLKFGIRKFKSLDYVHPVWMFNIDADNNIESSSYKLTLDACIIRKEVIKQLGFINTNFKTTDSASLELGFRYIFYGVFVRYIPWFVNEINKTNVTSLPCEDEFFFMHLHFKNIFVGWVLLRSIISGYVPLITGAKAYRNITKINKIKYLPFKRTEDRFTFDVDKWQDKISVVIPTLKRYPYLKKLLVQLNTQTLKPKEVIIADQTPENLREDIGEEFNFKLIVLYQETPGQSSSRNRAILKTGGEYVLLLDDDIEIKNDFIERHAKTIDYFKADVSSGVGLESEMESLPFNFTYMRISDVFPATVTLVKKNIFERSGLFDLAFETGKRADHDLGMRVYLSGAFMVLNPGIKIIHHRASSGGLREYGERRITYHSAAKSIFQWDIPSPTEIYLWLKYYDKRQAKEEVYIRILGLFRFRGSFIKRTAKWILLVISSPYILILTYINYHKALRIFTSNKSLKANHLLGGKQ